MVYSLSCMYILRIPNLRSYFVTLFSLRDLISAMPSCTWLLGAMHEENIPAAPSVMVLQPLLSADEWPYC